MIIELFLSKKNFLIIIMKLISNELRPLPVTLFKLMSCIFEKKTSKTVDLYKPSEKTWKHQLLRFLEHIIVNNHFRPYLNKVKKAVSVIFSHDGTKWFKMKFQSLIENLSASMFYLLF